MAGSETVPNKEIDSRESFFKFAASVGGKEAFCAVSGIKWSVLVFET